ncbi:DUF6622 family protein [Kosakonia sp. LAM2021]|uniref:DUF6622 family protein n=1 Tax=Kosakonia sp. LAM2021 TaxID=2800475 RepID=UPI00190E0C91|nr:DUF6622 family protein [Kosakonia sp. LAM2021]
MNMAHFLRATPVWVWILLAFLLRRGFAALYDRKMAIGRLFLLPVLFLAWGAYGVITETERVGVSLTMMTAGLFAGTALGYRLWRSQPPLRNTDTPGMIIRAGTPLTLGLIVIAFSIKFALTSALYLQPGLRSAISFCMLFGGVTGLVDGLFWGGTLRLYLPWYSKR